MSVLSPFFPFVIPVIQPALIIFVIDEYIWILTITFLEQFTT